MRAFKISLVALVLSFGTHASGDPQSAIFKAYESTCNDESITTPMPMCGDEHASDDEIDTRQVKLGLSRYGTVSFLSAPRLSDEILSDSENVIEYMGRYLNDTQESFGLLDPHNELVIHVISYLKYGRKSVKMRQYYQDIPVYGARLTAFFGIEGELLWIHSSIVPTSILDSQIDYNSLNTNTAPSCDGVVDSIFTDSDLVPANTLFDSAKYMGGESKFRYGEVYRGESVNGRFLEVLIDSLTCAVVASTRLDGNADMYYMVQHGLSSEDCVKSTFPADTCDYDWPEDYTERLWNSIHEIHENILFEHGWENWLVCRDESPLEKYDDGICAVSEPEWVNAGHVPCIEEGYTKQIIVGEYMTCMDIIGHELVHAIQDAEDTFGKASIFSASLRGEFADIVAEFTNTTQNWYFGGEECVEVVRKMDDPLDPPPGKEPRPDSYKWYHSQDYPEEGSNTGIMTHSAFLLGNSEPQTKYGVSVTPIGIDKTSRIYFDLTIGADSDFNYEESAEFLRVAASDLWGPASDEYNNVTDAMDAVGIWRYPMLVSYWYQGYQVLPTARHTPAAVSRDEGMQTVRYLFYADKQTKPSLPSDICYVYGDENAWNGGDCIGLYYSDRTTEKITATVYNGDIYVMFRPSGTSSLKHVIIDQSMNVHGPYNSGLEIHKNVYVENIGNGIIIFYVDSSSQSPRWKWKDLVFGRDKYGILPGKSYDDSPPRVVYDETSGDVWALWTSSSGVTKLSRARWQEMYQGNDDWSTTTEEPNNWQFPTVAKGTPGAEMFRSQLYASFTAERPYWGGETIWTDSCINPTKTLCRDSRDRGLPLEGYEGDWNKAVPRDVTSTIDPGELETYQDMLWLYSVDEDSGIVFETKKRGD